MGYAVDIADEAIEDLDRLVDSLPDHRRDRAIDALEAEFDRLALDPINAPHLTSGRPTWYVRFEVDGVGYNWAAVYRYTEDEKSVVVTHVYRLLL